MIFIFCALVFSPLRAENYLAPESTMKQKSLQISQLFFSVIAKQFITWNWGPISLKGEAFYDLLCLLHQFSNDNQVRICGFKKIDVHPGVTFILVLMHDADGKPMDPILWTDNTNTDPEWVKKHYRDLSMDQDDPKLVETSWGRATFLETDPKLPKYRNIWRLEGFVQEGDDILSVQNRIHQLEKRGSTLFNIEMYIQSTLLQIIYDQLVEEQIRKGLAHTLVQRSTVVETEESEFAFMNWKFKLILRRNVKTHQDEPAIELIPRAYRQNEEARPLWNLIWKTTQDVVDAVNRRIAQDSRKIQNVDKMYEVIENMIREWVEKCQTELTNNGLHSVEDRSVSDIIVLNANNSLGIQKIENIHQKSTAELDRFKMAMDQISRLQQQFQGQEKDFKNSSAYAEQVTEILKDHGLYAVTIEEDYSEEIEKDYVLGVAFKSNFKKNYFTLVLVDYEFYIVDISSASLPKNPLDYYAATHPLPDELTQIPMTRKYDQVQDFKNPGVVVLSVSNLFNAVNKELEKVKEIESSIIDEWAEELADELDVWDEDEWRSKLEALANAKTMDEYQSLLDEILGSIEDEDDFLYTVGLINVGETLGSKLNQMIVKNYTISAQLRPQMEQIFYSLSGYLGGTWNATAPEFKDWFITNFFQQLLPDPTGYHLRFVFGQQLVDALKSNIPLNQLRYKSGASSVSRAIELEIAA